MKEQTAQSLMAVFEEGVLKPKDPLDLRDHEEVEIVIRRRGHYRRLTREELQASYIAARLSMPLPASVRNWTPWLPMQLTNAGSCGRKESSTMATAFDTGAFERATDPILNFFGAEQAKALVAFRGDAALRARIEELARKNTEGQLTGGERAEYEGYVSANKFIAILQAKARKLLVLQLNSEEQLQLRVLSPE